MMCKSKIAFSCILLILFTLLNGCNNSHSEVNFKKPVEESNKIVEQTPVIEGNDKKEYLFDIYSEKEDIIEAVNEIALKKVQKIQSIRNNDYEKKGDSQRIEDARVAVVDCSREKLDKLVERGTLWIFDMEYELKPSEPDKFVPMWVLENLQDNGWVYCEGLVLLIYQENGKPNAPYYLATTFFVDELFTRELNGEEIPPDQVVTKVIKRDVPRLKLIKEK